MNCTRAKSDIALWAGGDLDDRTAMPLERHVAVCPECRDYRQRMSGSLQVLHEPALAAPCNLQDSVWPDVESRLSRQSQSEAQKAERLNRWLPAAAIAAACLAVIAFTSEPARQSRDIYGDVLPSSRSIGEMLIPYPGQMGVGERRQFDDSMLRDMRRFDLNSPPLPLWRKGIQ